MSETNLAEDMRKTMSDELDKMESDDVEEVVEEAEEIKEAEAVEEVEVVEEAPVEESLEETVEADDLKEEAEEEDVENVTLAPELVNPPTTWTAEAKAKYENLEPWAKQEVHKREKDMLNGVNSYREKAQFGEQLDAVISPYKAFLSAKGVDTRKAVQDGLNIIYKLGNSTPQEKGVMLRELAVTFGADIESISKEIDPNQLQIMNLQQQIQNMQNSQQTNLQTSQQQQTEAIENEIAAFANEADETGKLKRPYFDNVKGLMASLMESNAASGLEQAYEMAIKVHPDTSALVGSEQSRQANAKRQVEAKQKADKIKKAKATNPDTSPEEAEKNGAPKNLRETLEKEFDRLSTN